MLCNKLVDEKRDEILEVSKKIKYGILSCHLKGKTRSKNFNDFDNAFSCFKKMNGGNIMLEKAKQNQI